MTKLQPHMLSCGMARLPNKPDSRKLERIEGKGVRAVFEDKHSSDQQYLLLIASIESFLCTAM